MKEEELEITTDEFYTIFTQETKPWSRCKFEHKETSLKIRNVTAEVQIEINIEEIKSERIYSHSSSFCIPKNKLEQFIKALKG